MEASPCMLVIHYAGPLAQPGDTTEKGSAATPGRRLVVPLHVCVLQGLSFVKARLLSMEIPAHVSETLPRHASVENSSSEEVAGIKSDRLVKIDPYRGSWGLRLLVLELSNPTDVVFEISVSVQLESQRNEDNSTLVDFYAADFGYPKTRTDRYYSARVLIPLEHFKLPILDGSFFIKDSQAGEASGRSSSFSEKTTKAELNASIKKLISRVKVRWQSGRNSSGELNIKDAMHAALQTSVMDILLPDPLTFGFRLAKADTLPADQAEHLQESNHQANLLRTKGSIIAHNMTPLEVLVRNNTREVIKTNLSITCRDVAGQNCIEGSKATVLWDGVLSGISVEVPPLEEVKHLFSLYFLVPGEYTLVAAAVIDDADDILKACAKPNSADEPIFCRGPPFHVSVTGNL